MVIVNIRYYKKFDIDREKNNLLDNEKYDSISDYEVFKSNHKDIIFIETIVSTCNVYSFEEYEKQERHSNTTYFSRASYDPINVNKYIIYLIESDKPTDRHLGKILLMPISFKPRPIVHKMR